MLGYTGCSVGIQGSGVSKTETRMVDPFHAINHDAVGEVTLEVGQPQEVQVTFDDNLIAIAETTVVDGELRIKTTESYSSAMGLKVHIKVPAIDHLKLNSVGSIRATGVEGESLTIEQTGVGSLTASGSVKSVTLKVSGVGKADLKDLQAETATVKVSGVGGATVHASQSIDASTSGIGSIKVYGNPQDKKTKSDGIGKISFE